MTYTLNITLLVLSLAGYSSVTKLDQHLEPIYQVILYLILHMIQLQVKEYLSSLGQP